MVAVVQQNGVWLGRQTDAILARTTAVPAAPLRMLVLWVFPDLLEGLAFRSTPFSLWSRHGEQERRCVGWFPAPNKAMRM